MRAIITEYAGGGYTAITDGHRTRVGVEHALSTDRNHARAAKALAEKVGPAFTGEWVGGYLGKGRMAWVLKNGHGTSFEVKE